MFHEITLIGRLGSDPEMRYMPNGDAVTNFSVATSSTLSKERAESCPKGWKESYNGKNWELTIWWRVTCWRGLAETTNSFLSKGRQVFIKGEIAGEAADGTLNPRVWAGQDGVSKANFELTARMVKFIGGNGGREVREPAQSSTGTEYAF